MECLGFGSQIAPLLQRFFQRLDLLRMAPLACCRCFSLPLHLCLPQTLVLRVLLQQGRLHLMHCPLKLPLARL